MAKSSRSKTTPITEETKTEEPIIPIASPEDIPEIMVDMGDAATTETPTELVEIKETPEFEKEPLPHETIEVINENILVLGEELTLEQKILNYLEDKSGSVNLNGFLKGLFPSIETNAPAEWTKQTNVKAIKVALEALVSEGKIIIENNLHRLLCTFHYPDVETMKTAYRGLNDIQIIAQK